MKGKVSWFNKKKGYGFIIPEDKTKDVFVHYSGISSDIKYKVLEQDQIVEFDITKNEKGLVAINVKVVSTAQPVEELLNRFEGA